MSGEHARGTRVAVLFGQGYDPDVRVRRMTQSLAGAGWDVEILAWDRELAHPEVATDGPVRVRRIRVRSRRGRGLSQLAYLVRVGVAMIRHVRRTRPDVVHAVDLPMLLVAVLGLPFVEGRRPALVYDAFEIYAVMVAHRFPGPVLFGLRLLERRLPSSADLVITPGESRAAYFRARGVPSIVVPNWVDPEPKSVDRSDARRQLGLDAAHFCIAYVGGILRSRDLETLLLHARGHPEDVVLIAGTGDRDAWLRTEAAPLANVRVLGWVPDPRPVLAAADALYYALRPDHPYAALAAPNNLYVAIAHRTPLLYRPQGELGVVGAEYEIGVQFNDAVTLGRAVDRLRDRKTRARIRNVLDGLRRSYTWSAAVRPLLEAYPRKGTAARRAMPNGA